MYVNVAVLKETQPHERRVALTPSVVPKLIKLGGRLHMEVGAADAIGLTDGDRPAWYSLFCGAPHRFGQPRFTRGSRNWIRGLTPTIIRPIRRRR